MHNPLVSFEAPEVAGRYLIHSGAGSLHAVEIGNQGCCAFAVYDGSRMIFRMPVAFSGSFFLEAGFNHRLEVETSGECICHLHITYRPVRANAPSNRALHGKRLAN